MCIRDRIERENILVQTMEGRRQKAREGKWNGGFAPYGYKLVDGELEIAEDEAEIIRLIFDKYINTTMGVNGIAAWLNQQGYQKKKRQNNTLNAFAASFIKGVLDNPVYCGKLAYGRRKNEKIPGKRNAYHLSLIHISAPFDIEGLEHSSNFRKQEIGHTPWHFPDIHSKTPSGYVLLSAFPPDRKREEYLLVYGQFAKHFLWLT